MITLEDKSSAIIEKTKELCETIVSQESFISMKKAIDAFSSDEEAQNQYLKVTEKQRMLSDKQQSGEALTDEEIADFEKDRDALLANEVARSFVDAQQGQRALQDEVNAYLMRTFELGRVPEESELQKSGGCCGGGGGGGGCGCN